MLPFARPFLGQKETEAARRVILSGWVTQGPKVKKFEDIFSSYVGSKYACAVSSGTTALHLALIAVGVKPGDVVITVSHSFIATANVIRHCQAEPIFIDIDLNTFNISVENLKECFYRDCSQKNGELFYNDPLRLAVKASPLRYFVGLGCWKRSFRLGRVAAIMVVHQMGMPCDLNAILPLAHKFNLPVVEDAACAIGSEIKINSQWQKIGRPHGDIACFSFHPRKIITTGDGGMLTTNHQKYDKQFRLLRHHGMSVSDIDRHRAKKILFENYIITGYNYRLTDIQSSIGIEQIKRLPGLLKERREIADSYRCGLSAISWLKVPEEPYYCKTNWQSYPVRLKENAPLSRDRLMEYLFKRGISTRRGIMNAHQEKPYRSRPNFFLKKSELSRDTVILLPIFNGMSKGQIKKVIKFIKNV